MSSDTSHTSLQSNTKNDNEPSKTNTVFGWLTLLSVIATIIYGVLIIDFTVGLNKNFIILMSLIASSMTFAALTFKTSKKNNY